jgi:hypothetical protein
LARRGGRGDVLVVLVLGVGVGVVVAERGEALPRLELRVRARSGLVHNQCDKRLPSHLSPH